MQTFLPYRDFTSCAKVLDYRRLGKQRVETLQIMQALFLHKGWVNHPATRMWRGFEGMLLEYQIAITTEWVARGYKDTCLDKTTELFYEHRPFATTAEAPPWLGKRVLHSSHRANLLRKDPVHYGQFGWPESPAEGYYWPVSK